MLLYAVSIFLSAFLLFLVQPLIARIILPWFGGSAAVWTTCLMFFQTVLLAGYLYAHTITRLLKPRTQVLLHTGLLIISLAALPILPGTGWKPVDGLHPEWRILVLLAAVIGIPYLLLSTTGPLLQFWYARVFPGASPYRLYALSNAGSLLALLGYPAAIEPRLRIPLQAYGWSIGYAMFVFLTATTALSALRQAPVPVRDAAAGVNSKPSLRQLAIWAALAFCPSALLVAITSHVTQNIAPIPLLWVAPLALYLLSFILTFESVRWYRRGFWFPVFVASVALMLAFLFPENRNVNIKYIIPMFMTGFFACAMTCHGELYRLRPAPQSLTWFYLMISAGGALGGLFVGVLAPAVFNNYYELPIALLLTVVLASVMYRHGETALFGPSARAVQWGVFAALAGGFIYLTAYEMPTWGAQFRLMQRNFYGVLRVEDTPETDQTAGIRELHHGTIMHGAEFIAAGRHRQPTTYYGPQSGIGIALLRGGGPRKVGVVGLGAGTLAAYCRPGDSFRFYEINPAVLRIAENEFFFLRECTATLTSALGDARLSLEREPPRQFDVLAVDAFSSDSIPVHLLTGEAIQEYLRHLKPAGLLAIHVSNKYLDLKSVVSRAAAAARLYGVLISNEDIEAADVFRSDWIVLTRDPTVLQGPEWQVPGRANLSPSKLRLWTDDYSSILPILK
jgi:SAM-dependent methyltransferase